MPVADEQLRAFTYARQDLNRAAPDAATALRDVIAVYSSHPSAPLSLYARAGRFSARSFRSLRTVRLPAMRGSIHVLPADTGHLAFRAIPEPPARGARRLRNAGISQERYAKLRETLLAEAAEPRSARELRDALDVGESLTPVLRAMTHEGVLVRVGAPGLRSNELRYVAAEVPEVEEDDALAWLAAEYLRAFGPVRPEDFAWWAGVGKRKAAAALGAVQTDELGGGLLLRAEDRAELEAAQPPRGTVDLLPKWDPLPMGYAPDGRDRFADPSIVARLYEDAGSGGGTSGDSRPIVLVDGAAAGTWGAQPGDAGQLRFEVDLFERPSPKLRKALDQRLAEVAQLLS
jgi:Winged helix DNA-binding domain